MKIEIITVAVGVSKRRGWILDNFIEGLNSLGSKLDVHLNIILGEVPKGTGWGDVPLCDYEEVISCLDKANFDFNILEICDLKINPNYNEMESEYPGTGESHSKILERAIWTIGKNMQNDFLLIMDYDSFFIPSRIDDFIRNLEFYIDDKAVFGSLDGEFSVKEIGLDGGDNVDYVLYGNNFEKIAKGARSIIRLPRIHPFFILFTKNSVEYLLDNNLLRVIPLKTVGVFDDMDYILYGDCGVFLIDVISKKSGITWILKSSDDMPVLHYYGMTLKISKKESSARNELKKIYRDLYE